MESPRGARWWKKNTAWSQRYAFKRIFDSCFPSPANLLDWSPHIKVLHINDISFQDWWLGLEGSSWKWKASWNVSRLTPAILQNCHETKLHFHVLPVGLSMVVLHGPSCLLLWIKCLRRKAVFSTLLCILLKKKKPKTLVDKPKVLDLLTDTFC